MRAVPITHDGLARLIKKARRKFRIPAIAAAIINADSIALFDIQGTRVAGIDDPVTPADYFHIGSCAKSVLAVLAGKFVESGVLHWDTKFFDVFPGLLAAANKAYSAITLEDLLLCEAGIQAYTSGSEKFPEIDAGAENKRLEFIKYLVSRPPSSEKKAGGGFRFLYSNASYTLAAALLEQVAGTSYEQLVQDTVSNQWGIPVRFGWPNAAGADRQPWGHMISKRGITSFPPDHEYRLPYLIQPAGDLSMRPKDFAEYVRLHLLGLRGKDNFLSSRTYHSIHFHRKVFALGVGNGMLGGYRFSGIDGSAGTFFCRSILVPQSDFAFTIMMNAGSGTEHMPAAEWLTLKIVKKNFGWWWKFWM